MKLHFLYKVTNLLTGRYFVGVRVGDDPTWLSMPTNFSVTSQAYQFQLNPALLADLRDHGAHNFMIESLHASIDANEVEKMRTRIITQELADRGLIYNKPKVYANPVINEAKKNAMIGNKRAKKDDIKPKKVSRFGNNSKYVKQNQQEVKEDSEN